MVDPTESKTAGHWVVKFDVVRVIQTLFLFGILASAVMTLAKFVSTGEQTQQELIYTRQSFTKELTSIQHVLEKAIRDRETEVRDLRSHDEKFNDLIAKMGGRLTSIEGSMRNIEHNFQRLDGNVQRIIERDWQLPRPPSVRTNP